MLVIGYGSIGKRHMEILKSFEEVETVDVVSSRAKKCDCRCFDRLENGLLDFAKLSFLYQAIPSRSNCRK